MLKKTIKYVDFNDEEVEEDFFFHLSRAELVELEMSHNGGLSKALERIVAAEDGKEIIKEFKNIILKAYGKKTLDGRRFMKTQELRDDFESSEAYSVLFMETLTDPEKAAEFINGVVPSSLLEEVSKLEETSKPALASVPKPEPRIITRRDLIDLDKPEFERIQAQITSGEVILAE